MKYKNYNRKYISIYIALFVFYISLFEKSGCLESQELKEVDTNVNQTEVEDNTKSQKDDNISKDNNRMMNVESQTSNESGDKPDDTLVNSNSDSKIDLKQSDSDEINNHMNNHYNQTSENNLHKEDEEMFRDDGVLEETNEEILKEAESIEKNPKTEETEWEKEISDFEPAEILTIELNQQKEVSIILSKIFSFYTTQSPKFLHKSNLLS